jgi:hypothetical protein
MFKPNDKMLQANLFGMVQIFPAGVKKMLDKSWAPAFRKLVFEKINEERYAVLYSDIPSRPNFPVNVWVGLEIIKGMFDYTDEELIQHWHFDLLTAYALGQEGLGELTLSIRTIYYNRERLLEYEDNTGCNLLEEEFHAFTDDAIKVFKVNTRSQRMDTTFAGSFIRQMSRLELVVKVLQNFYNDLTETEQKRWQPLLEEYIGEEAQHVSFRLKRSEVEEHLKKVGEWLFKLHESYADDDVLTGFKSYQHMGRIVNELYRVMTDKGKTVIELKPAKEVSASSLQNPADEIATYRVKGGEAHVGEIVNVTETCTAGNPLQLVTDVAVYPNTKADEAIAAERAPLIKQRMELEEIITDGGFSGETSEKACDIEGVTLIPTEILGAKLSQDKLYLKDFHFADNEVATCPAYQSPVSKLQSEKTGRWIIHFSREQCTGCAMVKKCLVAERKRFYSISFTERQSVIAQRRQQFGEEEYRGKCRLRPAIEGTISRFKHPMKNDKLRVHSFGRVCDVIVFMAIGINFRRIWAYLVKQVKQQPAWAGQTVFSVLIRLSMVFAVGVRQLRANYFH